MLHVAAYFGHLNIVQWAVNEMQADLNVRDAAGSTPLHIACRRKQEDVASFLLTSGATSTARNNSGKLASDYLRKAQLPQLLALCLGAEEQERMGNDAVEAVSASRTQEDLLMIESLQLNTQK